MSFPRRPALGYQEAIEFITGFGDVLQVGMEGTGTYGAALTKVLQSRGMLVVERPPSFFEIAVRQYVRGKRAVVLGVVSCRRSRTSSSSCRS